MTKRGGKIEVSAMKKLLNESYKKKKDTSSNIDNRFILDENLSTDKTKVFLDNKTGDIKMVNRGTSDFSDVKTDAKLLMGFKDKTRFDEARGILNEIKNKYPDKSIDVLGHSLAGAIAEDIGKDERVKNIITLNKPTTPKDLLFKSKQSGKQYDIKTTGDLVSILNPFQQSSNDIIIKSETLNPYTEHKVDVLDRLPQDQIIGTGMNNLEKYIYDLIMKELSNIPKDEKLYNKIKKDISNKYKPSAYRSGMIVKKYKKEYEKIYGDNKAYYGKKNNSKGLIKWFNEEWKNQRGEIGYKKKGDIYRPTKRINKKTPKTFSELSNKQIKEAIKEKKTKGRVKKF